MKAMCGAECWTDHRLIISKLNLRIQPKRRPQGVKMPKRLNVTKLKKGNTKESFTDTLGRLLDAVQLDGRDVEAAWAALRLTTYDTAMECLGPVTRKHRDWFDKNSTEIMQLLDDKRQPYIDDPNNAAKKATLKNIRSTIQAKLRNMQDT